MYNTPRSGTLNGNSGGPEKAGPQSIPSSEGLGCEADHPPKLGTGDSQASELCPEAPPGHPGFRATGGGIGVHTGGEFSRAEFDGFESKSPAITGRKLTYREKLQDVRWKRFRDQLLRESNYTCCECGVPLTSGRMDLQAHHVVYISSLDPWDHPREVMLVLCDRHHRQRQAMEHAIFVKVGEHLAGLTIEGMHLQSIYYYFDGDPTLGYLPVWMRDLLEYPNHSEKERVGCELESCPLRAKVCHRLAEVGIKCK